MFRRKIVIFQIEKRNKIISEFSENITIFYLKIYIRDRTNIKNFDLYLKGNKIQNNNIPLHKFFRSRNDKVIIFNLKVKNDADSDKNKLNSVNEGNNNIYTNKINNKNKEKLKLIEQEMSFVKEKNSQLKNNINKYKENINECLKKKTKNKEKYSSLENMLLKQKEEIKTLKNEIKEANIKYKNLKDKSVEKDQIIQKNKLKYTKSNDNFAIISNYKKPKKCLSVESFNAFYPYQKKNHATRVINYTNGNMHKNSSFDSTHLNTSMDDNNQLKISTSNISNIKDNNNINKKESINNLEIEIINNANKMSRNGKLKNKIENNNKNDKIEINFKNDKDQNDKDIQNVNNDIFNKHGQNDKIERNKLDKDDINDKYNKNNNEDDNKIEKENKIDKEDKNNKYDKIEKDDKNCIKDNNENNDKNNNLVHNTNNQDGENYKININNKNDNNDMNGNMKNQGEENEKNDKNDKDIINIMNNKNDKVEKNDNLKEIVPSPDDNKKKSEIKYKFEIKEYNSNTKVINNNNNNNIINETKENQVQAEKPKDEEEQKNEFEKILSEFKSNKNIKQLLSKEILEKDFSLKTPNLYNIYFSVFSYLNNNEVLLFSSINKENGLCALLYWINYLENKKKFLYENYIKLSQEYNSLAEKLNTVESKPNSILSYFSKSGLKVLNSPHYLDIFNNSNDYFTKDNIFLFIYKMFFQFIKLYDEEKKMTDDEFITFMINEIKEKTQSKKSLREYIYHEFDEMDLSFENVIKAKNIIKFYKIENIEGSKLSKIDRATTIIGYVIRDVMGFVGLGEKTTNPGGKNDNGLIFKSKSKKFEEDISFNFRKKQILNACEMIDAEKNKCDDVNKKIREIISKYYII